MKTKILFALLLFGAVLNQPIFSQENEKLSGILQRLLLLSAALHEKGYTVCHIEADRLSEGKEYVTNRKLYSGNIYKIIGIGSDGISDLDIFVYHNYYTLEAKDASSDNLPEVTIVPTNTGDRKIKILNYRKSFGSSADEENFFVFIIGYKQY